MSKPRLTVWRAVGETLPDFVSRTGCFKKTAEGNWFGVSREGGDKQWEALPLEVMDSFKAKAEELEVTALRAQLTDALKEHDLKVGKYLFSLPHSSDSEAGISSLVSALQSDKLPGAIAVEFTNTGRNFLVGVYTSDFTDDEAITECTKAVEEILSARRGSYKPIGLSLYEAHVGTRLKVQPKNNLEQWKLAVEKPVPKQWPEAEGPFPRWWMLRMFHRNNVNFKNFSSRPTKTDAKEDGAVGEPAGAGDNKHVVEGEGTAKASAA